MARSFDWEDFPGTECIPPEERKPRVIPPETPHTPGVPRVPMDYPATYDDEGNDLKDLRFSGVDLSFHADHTSPPRPPLHPDARVPSRCQGAQCCEFDIGYMGHWYMYCLFQNKCLMRSVSFVRKNILQDLQKLEASLKPRLFVAWIFEHMPYGELTTKESELVESLEIGEYGFKERGHLSIRQLKLLKNIYCQAASRVSDLPPLNPST